MVSHAASRRNGERRRPVLRGAIFALCLASLVLAGRAAPADPAPEPVPLSIAVKGSGEIRLLVAEGQGRPCESSDNHVLFQGHVSAGQAIGVKTAFGWVCIDHTYGTFRESQWAGAALYGVADRGPHPSADAVLRIEIPTDKP